MYMQGAYIFSLQKFCAYEREITLTSLIKYLHTSYKFFASELMALLNYKNMNTFKLFFKIDIFYVRALYSLTGPVILM